MKKQMLLGVALCTLMAASLPAAAQTLFDDAVEAPGQAIGAAGAVAGTAAAVPGAVLGGVVSPVAGQGTESLREFRAEALRGDAYEIESSRMALDRSRDPKVRAQARALIRDHQATTNALLPEGTSLNAAGNVIADRSENGAFGQFGEILTAPLTLPVNLVGRTLEGRDLIDAEPGTPGRRVAIDPRRQQWLGNLAATRGRNFNATYAKQQVQSHREQVALYQGYAQNGLDETGRIYATQVLPTLQQHYTSAVQLDDRYANSEPAF